MQSRRGVIFEFIGVVAWLFVAPSLTVHASVLLQNVDDAEAPILQTQAFQTPFDRETEEVLDELPAPVVRSLRSGGGTGMGGMSGGPMGGMGGPGGGGGGRPVYLYSFFQPASNLVNQPGTLQVRGEGFQFGFPIAKGDNGLWLLNSRVEHEAFQTDALLPGTTQAFPSELWNINLGLMHIHPLSNGWTAGGMVGIGSSSDQPFASIQEVNANVLSFLTIPNGERDAWNFSLFYAPLGQLRYPIPGFAYSWRPSEQFQMNAGIPFSLNYRPTETISFNMSYLPLTNANATLRWTPDELWTLYGGYLTHSQGFELADRTDIRQRLFNFDQRLQAGVQRSLGKGFFLDGSVAYLFDRSYFLSDSFFGGGAEKLRIDPGVQFLLKVEWSR